MRRRQFIAGVAGSVAFPLAGRALPANVPVVGVLSFNSAGPMMASRIDGFLRGLSELNYVADQNVSIEYRWAEFHGDRVPALADDLVRRRVAVIATFNGFTALAAKAANATIPIVFGVGDDPVKMGLVASMNRPGGNATGVSMFTGELDAKRLGLLAGNGARGQGGGEAGGKGLPGYPACDTDRLHHRIDLTDRQMKGRHIAGGFA